MTVNISIGMTWTKGGATMMYNAVCGDLMDRYERISLPGDSKEFVNCTYRKIKDGDYLVSEGDIKSLDTSISPMLLVLYMLFAQLWIENDGTIDYRAFIYMLEACAERLAGKVVRWIDEFILLIGVMPSGSLDTSHGDSWIVGVMYWLAFIFHTMLKSSLEVRRLIWLSLVQRKLAIWVFGDDFLQLYHRKLFEFVGVNSFASYISRYHNVEMKNMATYSSLVTYFRVRANEVVETVGKGPVYLKRLFVRSDNFNLQMFSPSIAEIIPYRPYRQYPPRVGVPNDRAAPVYMNLSRIIGLAYDSLGICPVTYSLLEFVYNLTYQCSLRIVSSGFIDENLPIWLRKDDKYFRKIGYKLEDASFPSRQRLIELNNYDRDVHRPRYFARTWQDCYVDYIYS